MSAGRRSDPAELLARALAREYGSGFRLGEVTCHRWASATFEGERASLVLHDVDPAAGWLAGLPSGNNVQTGGCQSPLE